MTVFPFADIFLIISVFRMILDARINEAVMDSVAETLYCKM